MSDGNRKPTSEELHLMRWMIEHSGNEALTFLPQLGQIEITSWKCSCGCASLEFEMAGATRFPSVHPIANFVFGEEATLSGIFIYESGGFLQGLEVYGLAGDAPRTLPTPDQLR